MTDFDQRLEKAIRRGHRISKMRAREEAEKAVSEKELRQLHTQYRIELSEHIEICLKKLLSHFPGFRFETVVSERGWGAAISRDDLRLSGPGRRENLYSRLELVIRPIGQYFVLELAGKGTVRNREFFNRTHFEKLGEADPDTFVELIDHWSLDFAQLYASKS